MNLETIAMAMIVTVALVGGTFGIATLLAMLRIAPEIFEGLVNMLTGALSPVALILRLGIGLWVIISILVVLAAIAG